MRVNSLRNLLAGVGIVTLGIACGVSEYRAKSAPPATRGVAMDTSRHMGELAAAPAERVAGKAMTAAATEPSSLQAAEGAGQPAIGIGAMAASQPDRYLIKNATILIETDDARAATDQLTASLQTLGGYVGDLHESTDGLGRRSVTMQIRVPADKFDTSMQSLESIGKVLNKQVTTQDVTEEFVDTDARTRNLKKMEERLLDHLNRFGELKDILGVEKELTRVREDIERLDGRLRYLGHRVTFSTVAITLQEKPKAEPVVPVQTFSTAKVTTEAMRSLVAFGQEIWYRVIWIAIWSPVWLPLALVVWLAWRRVRRAKRQSP